jgi:hypothetical protein
MTKNPAYAAETGAPSGGLGAAGPVTGLKTEEIVRPLICKTCVMWAPQLQTFVQQFS